MGMYGYLPFRRAACGMEMICPPPNRPLREKERERESERAKEEQDAEGIAGEQKCRGRKGRSAPFTPLERYQLKNDAFLNQWGT